MIDLFTSPGFFARNVESSYRFPERFAARVSDFVCRNLPGHEGRAFDITDEYGTLHEARQGVIACRLRAEGKVPGKTLIVECRADRYFILPNADEESLVFTPVLRVSKTRNDWTMRIGSRLYGRHYGAFSRISIDAGELVAAEAVPPRRSYPGDAVIEFEWCGIGKSATRTAFSRFRTFCSSEGIPVLPRERGLRHREIIAGTR